MGASLSADVEFIAKLVPELDVDKAKEACKGIEGHNTQMQAILQISSDEHKTWVEGSKEELSLQQQWLDFKVKEFGEKAPQDKVDAALTVLNDHLVHSSFLASKARLMLADFAVFYSIRPYVKSELVVKFPALCRWFNTVQNNGNVRRALKIPLVAFPLQNTLRTLVRNSDASDGVVGTPPKIDKQQNANDNSKPSTAKKNQAPVAGKASKAEKKEKKTPKPAPAAEVDQPDVTKLDIRVGLMVKVWNHESSDKLYCEKIDVGEAEPREIGSGLRAFYADASMIEGRKVLVLCNLKPRKLAGFNSNGMVLCASNEDHTQVELVDVPEGAKVGERIAFDGIKGGPYEPFAPNAVNKKKVFETVAPALKTSKDKIPCWIDPATGTEHPFTTSAGVCTVPTIVGGSVS